MINKQLPRKGRSLIELIFFGNYFYGFCAVALSIEAALQQRMPLNGFGYFFLVFAVTVLYYSYPYIRKNSSVSTNPRTNWYSKHYRLMWWNQLIISVILILALVLFLFNYWKEIRDMSLLQWVLVFIFPAVAFLYYGLHFILGKYNLRNIGWLKPFVIGFTWAGLVTIYPVLYYDITHGLASQANWVPVLLFVKNLMFITVLCIMFDIKDYGSDYFTRLRTFVVKVGLRKTIFYILLPLSLAGLGSFIYYAISQGFHPAKLLLNTIPFILLIGAGWSLRRRRSLLYYLVIIDGLMIVKALCGSIAMIYF